MGPTILWDRPFRFFIITENDWWFLEIALLMILSIFRNADVCIDFIQNSLRVELAEESVVFKVKKENLGLYSYK